VRRETILMIWAGGFVLAVALYLTGPDRFFDAGLDAIDAITTSFHDLLATLGAKTDGLIRACAIAGYAVFAVLAFMAAQRGQRGIGALAVITAVTLVLVWRPYSLYPAPLGRWLVVLALVLTGAVAMTRRLSAPPPRRDAPRPYPPGER
jgi:hypothetical protein